MAATDLVSITHYKHVPNDILNTLADNLREADRLEVWRLGRMKPRAALAMSAAMTPRTYVASYDGEPISIFGVYHGALIGHGAPWMLATDKVMEMTDRLMSVSRRFIASALTRHTILSNTVDDENRAAKLYLRRLGFTLEEPVLNMFGHPVRKFKMEATDV